MLKGIYTLVIGLTASTTISVGKLGNISFPYGYYAYVGSVLNGLEARIARHLKEEKLFHWHIDLQVPKKAPPCLPG
jgi:Uri superfamily endonuclease